MNKIYRRLWSTARQCWVVASELAAPRGKAASTVLKSMSFCLLLMPGALMAQELESEVGAEEELDASLSDGSLPHALRLIAQSNRDAQLYAAAFAGQDSLQLGVGANAAGSYNAAVGPGARSSGYASSAFGHLAVAIGQSSTAIGAGSNATGGFALALGHKANASGMGSIALGYDSVASEDYSVSVGSSSRKRKIVNVDDGALNSNSFEVVNGRQLQRVIDSTRVPTLLMDAGTEIREADRAIASGFGSLAIGQIARAAGEGAVSLGHDAIADSNNAVAMGSGSYVSAEFGVALGGNARATHKNSVALGEKSVTTGEKQVSVGSAAFKRKIVNLDDGAINASSSEAVTGRQLFQESQRVGGLVKQASVGGTMYIGADNTGNVLTVSNKNGGKRYVNGVQNATLSASSSDAVTGQQLFATNNQLAAAVARLEAEAPALGRAAAAEGAGANSGTAVGNASKAYNNRSVALGNDARAGVDAAGNKLADAHGAVSLGGGTRSGESSTAAGNGAQAVGKQAVAVGAQAKATGQLSTAMGYNAQATTGQATAIGRETVASGTYSTALGNLSKATAESAVALGDRAEASHYRSVALGRQSVTTANDQVSVGNASINLKRRIVNVQDGALSAGSSEAVTGNQLFATNTTLGTVQATANQAKATADLGLSKADWLGRLISGGPTGGVQIGAENAGSLLSVRNQTGGRRVITGLHNADLSTASTEAVTGQQLFATNNNVATAQAAADAASGKADALGGLVSQVTPNGSLRLGGENTGGALDVRNKAGTGRVVDGVAAGRIATDSDEAISGKQLYATEARINAVIKTAVDAQTVANRAEGKADVLGGLVKQESASGSMRLGGENTGGVLDVRNKSGAGRSLTGLADGAISATSTEAVTGKQLQATHDRLATAQSRADAAHAGATAAQATADQAKAKADATGNAVATAGAIDYDKRATASGNLAMAMGQAAKANGTAAFAMGHSAIAAGDNAVSVGSASSASARAAVALGGNAKAKHENSVALGERSETGGTNEVSVGNAVTGLKRRVVNVDDARLTDSSTDAVTGKQLFATNEKVQANEAVLAGHGTDLAAQSGRIADNRRDLDALRSEFEDFDPDLDGVVKFAADGSVDIAGGKLRGVAAGDISSATSTDAVTGGQLFDTNRRVEAMELVGRFLKIATNEFSEDASAGNFSVAIGDSAEAGSSSAVAATAVGSFARALGTGSVAIGSSAFVEQSSENGFALGGGASVYSSNGSAIGGSAKVDAGAEYSVALGSGSVASEQYVVSVGNAGLKRRVTNVERGHGEHDASTIGQLADSLSVLGGGAGMNSNGDIIAPTYNVQGGTQNNVGDALAALDSAVVTADSRVDSLEGKLRSAFQDGPSVRADGLNQLVLAGANGSVLTNLADGRIAAGSRDAVNGSQLFEAKQEIARNRNDLNDLRGERDGLLSRGLMAAEQGNVIDFGGARLTGVADGVVSAESRDVVSGRQLFATHRAMEKIQDRTRHIALGDAGDGEVATIAGGYGVAIGAGATASVGSEGGTAIGAYSAADGRNSVALGRGSYVHARAEDGFAVGVRSYVGASGGLAIGASSQVQSSASNAVALGTFSVATDRNTVSVGADWLQRRIVNVASGRNATDVATVGQLRGALATLGGDVDANGNIINPNFNVQGSHQSTLNEALSTLDSAVVTNTTRTDRVESQLRSVFQDSPSVRNDGLNQLTFAGANGMVLSNVANGAIAAGSRDAVNGGQLHSMQQQLNGRMDGLEQRIDGQPQALQSRALTLAAVDSAASSTTAATPAADEPAAPPPSSGDNKVVADAGNAPKSSPQPQADAPKPESPKPQVDTAELEKMLARANEYSDGISREVDARLDKMDKRFNRMAAMSSAQSAMAMNTAGLNTYNRLGAGVGYSDGESAMAVGYQRVLNDKGSATFSLNGAFTNSGERSMGVGVGIGW
ncbi:ESPR-type extended signal peptide-containing protein [Stenotrophomonas sp. SAU14A_NAIMI4_5]|uniref:ESPR-type extended signal peptide-containing protein n=1 Tax=Stenotrophomonas sp. SAU14A_NAIMI4_5 TaxID=2072413 RepID=UPI00131F3EA9|nr:ESPR-type extended signal peptide-containing protein [Stenotrophomonas sp. SAU14A_NAIMI4_5]